MISMGAEGCVQESLVDATVPGPAPACRAGQGTDRVAEFLRTALEGGATLVVDWRVVVGDVLRDLEQIVQRDGHPDTTDTARLAIGTLAGLVAEQEVVESVYLGERGSRWGA